MEDFTMFFASKAETLLSSVSTSLSFGFCIGCLTNIIIPKRLNKLILKGKIKRLFDKAVKIVNKRIKMLKKYFVKFIYYKF